MMSGAKDPQVLVERLRRGFSFLMRREMASAAAELRTLADTVIKTEEKTHKEAIASGKEDQAKVIARRELVRILIGIFAENFRNYYRLI